jgi:hypothetical protein
MMNTLEETEETGDPYILLHAIMGLSCTETMQLAVRLNDDMLCALVNSGSTHSFISVSAASCLHLDSQPLFGLHVSIANGDWVACAGVYRATRIFIDQEEFILDLFMIPLEGYDLVLGVHWLHTPGPILWDFDRARMSCWRDDHRIVWQGVTRRRQQTVAYSLAAQDLMALLLQEFDDIFATPT